MKAEISTYMHETACERETAYSKQENVTNPPSMSKGARLPAALDCDMLIPLGGSTK